MARSQNPFESKVQRATADARTLRATIPKAVSDLLKLQDGDIVHWEITAEGKDVFGLKFRRQEKGGASGP